MKKSAKKSVPAKSKSVSKTKSKLKAKPTAAKPAKKAKAVSKKAKSVAKKAPVKAKSVAKKALPPKKPLAVKAKPAAKSKSVVKKRPAARPVAAPPSPPTPVAPPPAPTLPSSGEGTVANPWVLKTPPGGGEFQAYRDESQQPPALVVRVGSTELKYDLRCLSDLHEMLKAYGDWMLLGAADEQQPVVEGTVEAWARSSSNPVGGWYGLKNGLRGRFGVYVPPVMEVLGLAEVEHFPKDNRMRAK